MDTAGLPARLNARLLRGQAMAESMMTLTLAAYSPTGLAPDADGYETLQFADEGPTSGKVQGGSQAGKDTPTRYVNVGGVERPVLAAGLHIPITSAVPVAGEQRGIGWEYEVVAVGPLDDPALLGRRYLVVGVPAKSYATARRLDVVQVN